MGKDREYHFLPIRLLAFGLKDERCTKYLKGVRGEIWALKRDLSRETHGRANILIRYQYANDYRK